MKLVVGEVDMRESRGVWDFWVLKIRQYGLQSLTVVIACL
jgi:hypothetical protein